MIDTIADDRRNDRVTTFTHLKVSDATLQIGAAHEAIQNPQRDFLDCFAALAMTVKGLRRLVTIRRTGPKPERRR